MIQNRSKLPYALAGLVLLCGHAAVAAQACARPLTVGLSDLGYGAYQERGQIAGLVPELLHELARRSGCELLPAWRPRARALQEFTQGELDMLTSAMQSPERDLVGHFMPYGYTDMDLLVREDLAKGISSFQALALREDARLGLVRGITLGAALEQKLEPLLAGKRIEYSTDFANLAAKLRAGRIQLAIIPFAMHAKMMADGDLGPTVRIIEIPDVPPSILGLYLNRNNVPPADHLLLQRHLGTMIRDGWVQRRYAHYFGEAKIRRIYARGAPLQP